MKSNTRSLSSLHGAKLSRIASYFRALSHAPSSAGDCQATGSYGLFKTTLRGPCEITHVRQVKSLIITITITA